MGSLRRQNLFIQVRVGSGTPRIRGVHSGSRGFTLVHLGVFGFIRVLAGSLGGASDRRVHSSQADSLGRA